MDLTILVLTSFHKKFLESLSIKNKIEIFPNYIDVTKNTVKEKIYHILYMPEEYLKKKVLKS